MATIVGIDQIFARRSPSLKQMGLAGQELAEDEMVRLMLQEPKLVRRPMMRVGDQLFVGGGASVLDSVVAAASWRPPDRQCGCAGGRWPGGLVPLVAQDTYALINQDVS